MRFALSNLARSACQARGRGFSCGRAPVDGLQALSQLVDWEAKGLPPSCGTDTDDGFSLGPTKALLARLGSPHENLKVIQVAGTKGKGSVGWALAAMLRRAGLRVGLYSSPHLLSPRERFRVTTASADPSAPMATEIDEATINDLVHNCMSAIHGCQREHPRLSLFEVYTALAFKYFEQVGVDCAIMEAGVGGARDATNVCSANNSILSVLTHIGLEHVDALGGSLESITRAKARICKPGRTLVLGPQSNPVVLDIVEEEAQLCGSPVVFADRAFDLRCEHVTLPEHTGEVQAVRACRVYSSSGVVRDSTIHLGMHGAFQRDNILTAVAALDVLVSDDHLDLPTTSSIIDGLHIPAFEGRFQLFKLPAPPKQSQDVWIAVDGAHTPDAAEALVASMQEMLPAAPVTLVAAMASDKDIQSFMTAMRKLNPVAAFFTTVNIAGSMDRSATPGQLLASWQTAPGGSRRCREQVVASLDVAVDRALRELGAGGSGVCLITGSLHAAAQALKRVVPRLLKQQ
ncbi:unnamed protein product [Pedinophyceae sp. YPF-701]|nr:unnamed protein product [Pedinophyceae sp. YPF-701]